MECPQCGYLMSAFDAECPRCQRLGATKIPPKPPSTLPSAQIIEEDPTPTPIPNRSNLPVIALLGVLLPLVGIIVGIVYACKPSASDRQAGAVGIAVSLVAFILYFAIFGYLIAMSDTSDTTDYRPSQTEYRPSAPAPPQSEYRPSATTPPPARSSSITYDQYQRVETGMTYDQVVNIFGRHGTEDSRVEMEGYPEFTTVSMSWQNNDGSNAIVMFQGGVVNMKAHAGLR